MPFGKRYTMKEIYNGQFSRISCNSYCNFEVAIWQQRYIIVTDVKYVTIIIIFKKFKFYTWFHVVWLNITMKFFFFHLVCKPPVDGSQSRNQSSVTNENVIQLLAQERFCYTYSMKLHNIHNSDCRSLDNYIRPTIVHISMQW